METAEKSNISSAETGRKFKIIVNGREKMWIKPEISFDEVIILAFGSILPNVAYTVNYKTVDGDRAGHDMVKGDIIKVKEGMIFNATATDKS